uniref:Potassium channel toxin alpha-KTx 21.1 n=1 Tax=Tityus serrulatus TaxID=6887 RepID=KA211_TITSE|nr:RecName: Full=Potassium channel toxin alpha-KTx 21.1; AltName: Full=Tityustoxin-15; Short=Ts15; Flags: Precursor [Tityus serrulatus]QPD99020.1 potassium channel toxin Ts15 [Tityus serrulatus]
MQFSGVVLILISMTLVNFVFFETKVEAGKFGKCKPNICAKTCQTEKGKGMGYCNKTECVCSEW